MDEEVGLRRDVPAETCRHGVAGRINSKIRCLAGNFGGGSTRSSNFVSGTMMASDGKIKTDSASKKEPAAKDKGTSDAASTKSEKSGTSAAEAPANYSRGEGQKAVSQAYRDNWNAIYAKKTKKKAKR
jgi:hypothetical protein